MRSVIRRIAIVGLCIVLCTIFSSVSYAARPTVIKVAHDLSPLTHTIQPMDLQQSSRITLKAEQAASTL